MKKILLTGATGMVGGLVTPWKEPNFTYKVSRFLYPLIKLLGGSSSIQSTELAASMFEVGMNGSEKEILENKDILRVVSA